MKLQRLAGAVALTATALLAILALTLRPAPGEVLQAARTPLDCLVCGDLGGADVLLNVALFLPLGLGLWGLRRSARFTIVAALLLSFSIELLQYTVVVGRDATLSDVVTNTAGAWLGWLLGAFGARLYAPTPVAARALTAGATALWLGVYLLSAWALHPAPSRGTYWGQWAHDFPARGTFAGKVSGATLNGRPLPDGPLPATPAIHDRLASGAFTLAVRATSGRRWEDNAQIFGLANDTGDIFLEWRQKNRDYEFTMRSRGALLRVHSPELLLPGAAPDGPGVPVALEVTWRDGIITASAFAAGHASTRRLVLAPSWNWTFVWPWDRDRGAATAVISAAWLGVTLVLTGFWGGRAGGPFVALASAGLVALALGLVPPMFGLQRTSAADWIAAALGLGLGAALGRYMPRARSAWGP